jgi:hypothetical protein
MTDSILQMYFLQTEKEKSVISSLLCLSLIQFDMTNTISKVAATVETEHGSGRGR